MSNTSILDRLRGWHEDRLSIDTALGLVGEHAVPTTDLLAVGIALMDTLTAENERLTATLKAVVETGTKMSSERVGDMYSADGYIDYQALSEEAEIAQAALGENTVVEQEFTDGYRDGRDPDAPEPSANRSHAYRHSFAVGRAELANRPRPAWESRINAAEAEAKDAAQ